MAEAHLKNWMRRATQEGLEHENKRKHQREDRNQSGYKASGKMSCKRKVKIGRNCRGTVLEWSVFIVRWSL